MSIFLNNISSTIGPTINRREYVTIIARRLLKTTGIGCIITETRYEYRLTKRKKQIIEREN